MYTTREDIDSVTKASDSRLSLHGFASYVFQFEYTVRGYVLHDNSRDNGFLPHLAFGTLTKNIGQLDEALESVVSKSWKKQLDAGETLNEAHEPEFYSSAMGFATDIVIAAEGLKFTPRALKQ
ncbi:MAG: hypothetical protein LQ340_003817 [Diploschistes diacapsis]|nr:MAG: hypothetical protein LQ340_003817 [Diploschistes diacapsis]